MAVVGRIDNILHKIFDYSKKSAPSSNIKRLKLLQKNLESNYIVMEKHFSEWENILITFNDLYFKMRSDGIIVDYYPKKKIDNYYIKPKDFILKKMQDILPEDASKKVQRAIDRIVKDGEESVVIKYSLMVGEVEKCFIAKMGSYNGSFLVMMVGIVEDYEI